MKNFNLEPLGAGAGLRGEHFSQILAAKPPFRWFEIIVEDYIGFGGYIREAFEQIRSLYKIIPHGVCMSIGSTDPLDMEHLRSLKSFLDMIEAPWMSDHLCFTMVDHTNLNELIPIPFTKESADNVVSRVKIVQEYLQRPFLLENVTRYLTVSDREMSEGEFINYVLENANCGLLLDVTNVHLNSLYHHYDAFEFISALPLERVGQIHLAGWEADGEVIIDSHDAPVPTEVWELFKKTIALTGPSSVVIEWDKQLPPVERLLEETEIANQVMSEVLKNSNK